MSATFATYEEAEELQSNCVVCGRNKFTIVAKFEKTTSYALERCTVSEDICGLHCHGHQIDPTEAMAVSSEGDPSASGWSNKV